MALSAETIDYGPCAFIEAYTPRAVSVRLIGKAAMPTVSTHAIAQWNLARFAETLLPLIDPVDPNRAIPAVTEVLEQFADEYEISWLTGMRAKLGLREAAEADRELASDWLALLENQNVDFTLAWRRLATWPRETRSLSECALRDAHALATWLDRWRRRAAEPIEPQARKSAINRVNPLYIPRNNRVEEALTSSRCSDRKD